MENRKKNQKALLEALLLMAMFFPYRADAYLDPGTGSLIVQAIIAGTVALSFYLKLYWKKISGFLKKKDSDKDAEEREKDEKEK